MPFAHVEGHVDQHRAERGEGHKFRQRRGGEDDEQQRERVDDAGHRRAGAALHVGGGAGNRAGCGNAAKKRADDIGQALRDEFLVGVVPVVYHAVGDHGAEEGLDGGQQRDRHSRLEQVLDVVPG